MQMDSNKEAEARGELHVGDCYEFTHGPASAPERTMRGVLEGTTPSRTPTRFGSRMAAPSPSSTMRWTGPDISPRAVDDSRLTARDPFGLRRRRTGDTPP